MRAAFSMYDLLEVRHHTDALWRGLAGELRNQGVDGVPSALDRSTDSMAVWTAPDLLLAQTCGYPLTHAIAAKVRIVATPCYDAYGCIGANYCSVIVVRKNDLRSVAALHSTKAAFNSRDSQSGYAALRASVAPYACNGRFFSSTIETGGHVASLAAVQDGTADVCAIDAVTYTLLQRHRPGDIEGLEIIGTTPTAPGLPFITALDTSDAMIARLRAALRSVVTRPDLADTRAALLLRDFEILPAQDYRRILEMEQSCIDQGYGELR